MNERVCRNCKWYDQLPEKGNGTCKRHPPINLDGEHPYTDDENFCGEWSDVSIIPGQEDFQELIRRFAVALAASSRVEMEDVWEYATRFAETEPQI
jgi:hypothetical protein